jgi:hypothetical protein
MIRSGRPFFLRFMSFEKIALPEDMIYIDIILGWIGIGRGIRGELERGL